MEWSARAGCAYATLRPIRWEWSIIPITSSGSKSGAMELMRQLGFSYRDMEQDHGCFIPVVDARCRYKAPARYDEEIIVRTHLKNVRESVIHFGYELVRANDGEVLAEGETTHMVIDAQMKTAPLPPSYLKAFREAVGKQA
jgi:acyl-CoA thioester hydrolase